MEDELGIGVVSNISPLDGSFEEIYAEEVVINAESKDNSDPNNNIAQIESLQPSNIATCNVCKKSIHKRSLLRHERTHNKHMNCSLCPAKFADNWSLKDHEARHANPFICDICGKHLTSRSGLHRHVRSHSNDHKIECDICKQQFNTQQHFEGHRNSKHLKYKPFKCSTCDKSFPYAQSCARHMKDCRGATTHVCDECGAVVNSKRALEQHKDGKHGKTRYYCRCGRSYTWIRSLNRHLKSCDTNKM